MTKPTLFPISIHRDDRGELRYCNEFNLSSAKRFYSIRFGQIEQIRAWQAHKVETKAILPIAGITKIVLVELFDFDNGITGSTYEFVLDSNSPAVLLVPSGYANGLQAKSMDSELMIFSNFSLNEAKNDDFRFDRDMFYSW